MDAPWPTTSSATADDQEEAYDAWASAFSNTSTSATSSATQPASTRDGVTNMLAADMPLSSNLDHVFGHITYAQRNSPAATPAAEADVPILKQTVPEQDTIAQAAPFSVPGAEADSATLQVSQDPVSSLTGASGLESRVGPLPEREDVLNTRGADIRPVEGQREFSSTEDDLQGTAFTGDTPEESLAEPHQRPEQESHEVVKTILGQEETISHGGFWDEGWTPQDESVQATQDSSLDWVQTDPDESSDYVAPSTTMAVEESQPEEGLLDVIQHEEAPSEFVQDELHATSNEQYPFPSGHTTAESVLSAHGKTSQSNAGPSNVASTSMSNQTTSIPTAFEAGDDEDVLQDNDQEFPKNTSLPADPFTQESVEDVPGSDFFSGLQQGDVPVDTDWFESTAEEQMRAVNSINDGSLPLPNATQEATSAGADDAHVETTLSPVGDTQQESVDTDWLKGETAPSVEDSWAQALGDPDKLDDAWGAALDDDEGFLEDEPVNIVPAAAASASAQAPTSAPARSTAQYAPPNVTTPAVSAQPSSTFTPIASPFAAYQAPPAISPPVPKKEPSATPMQFFEDLPTTRPAPARRPKPPQAIPPTVPVVPPPPSGSAPPTSLGRPMPPPRVSSASYSQQPQFQAPQKLDLFPPQPQVMPSNGSSSQPPVPPTMSAPPVNNRYSPALTRENVSMQASKPPTPSLSRYAAAQPPPAVQRQSSYAPQTAPMPPQPQSQQPITPTMPEQNSFITSPPNAAQNAPSRYSPASAPGQAAGSTSTTTMPSRPTNRFIPRTSSPLVHSHQLPQTGSSIAAQFSTPAASNYAPTNATLQPQPPVSAQRYGPPTSSLRPVGAPRTLERSVSFAAQPPPQQHLQDGVTFAPPQRPRTSSPVHTRARPQVSTVDMNRPATSNLAVSPSAVVHAPSSAEHDMQDFVLPENETALDQLQRWRGTSIFRWGAGGLIVSTIPKHIPRYGGGQNAPKLKPVSGEVKLRKVKDMITEDDGVSTFPGPLRSKNKKKDVLTWLSARISVLEQTTTSSIGSIRNAEEKVLLWKVLRLMVEHDGQLTVNTDAVNAVQELLRTGTEHFTSAETPVAIVPEESQSPDPTVVPQIRAHLLAGEREKAIWHAVDHRRWGHAFILASTAENKVWKQVVQEFVRKQVRSTNPDNRSLGALYEVFAGNWDDSVDQLVPLSARQGFQMVSTAQQPGQAGDEAGGLEKWRETLCLILNNRSNGDENALIALGKLLVSYGRIEAAHVCYLFARNVAIFGASDDTQSHFTLLGTDLTSESSSKVIDSDSILLTEVYEFALSLAPTASVFFPPHLQAYKLQHAYQLAELGMRGEAQQYCEAILSATKSSTRGSAYYHTLLLAGVDDLTKRLSQSPQSSGSSWKISTDKVAGSVWSKFNKFVVGEETDGTAAGTGGPGDEAGPFGKITGGTPTISRTPSVTDLSGYGNEMYRIPSNVSGGGGRYAPATIAASPDQSRLNPYTAGYGSSPELLQRQFERRISSDVMPTNFGSPPRAPVFQRQTSTLSRYASNDNYNNMQQSTPYEPQPLVQSVPEGVAVESSSYPASRRTSTMGAQPSSQYQPSAPTTPAMDESGYLPQMSPNRYSTSSGPSERSRPSSARYEPSSAPFVPSSQDYNPSASYAPSVASESAPAYGGYDPSAAQQSITPVEESEGYKPTAPLDQPSTATEEVSEVNGYSPYGYQAPEASLEDDARGTDGQSTEAASTGYQPSSDAYAPPISSYQPVDGYEPPSGGYVPYNPDPEEESAADIAAPEEATKPKRRGIMDLDDDDADEPYSRPSADDLKRQEKAQKDRENEELIRKAAEADAQRDADAKAAKKSGGWFGGWLGGKKDSGPAAPVVHKGKLGEKLSLYYDPETKKWVNPNATEEEKAASAAKATPPPPRAAGAGPPPPGPGAGPPMGAAKMPPAPFPPSLPGSGPPSRPGSAAVGSSLPPSAPGSAPGSAPPSRPPTSAAGAGVATLDDLLGGPPGPRAGGTARAKKGKGSRYVDVMAK